MEQPAFASLTGIIRICNDDEGSILSIKLKNYLESLISMTAAEEIGEQLLVLVYCHLLKS